MIIVTGIMLIMLLIILRELPIDYCCYNYTGTGARKFSPRLGHIKEWHHGYIGVLALLPVIPLWLRIIALIPLVDDLIQHTIQLLFKEDHFQFVLHRLAAKVGLI